MPQYFFLLGNTPALSLAELQGLLPDAKIEHLAEHIASVELSDDAAARQVMDVAGGLVKAVKVLQHLDTTDPATIETAVTQVLMDELSSSESSKIKFGVGEVGRDHLEPLSTSTIKNTLIKNGYKARYMEGSRQGLSASVLLHRASVVEVVVVQIESSVYLTETIGIQDIDRWTIRDREKPYFDRRKGMLPPKVARMMVNIALAHLPQPKTLTSDPAAPAPTVYDPFCGTGTILIEGVLRDCHVVGSDSDPYAVAGAQKNLQWLLQNLEDVVVKSEVKIFQGEVANVRPEQSGKNIDCIVTEPFLGKPTPRPEQVPNIVKGLEKLYFGAFKNWTRILKDGGIVAMVFPIISAGNQRYGFEAFIDKLVSLGYTTQLQPIIYSRPQAITQRQLYIFRFNQAKTN